MKHGWRIAARNLLRNRRRNAATGVAIALGYAGLLLLGGYAIRTERLLAVNTVYLQHTGHVAVYKPGGLEQASARPSRFAFEPEEQAKIQQVLAADPRIELAGRYLMGVGLAGNGCRTVPFVGLGLEPEVEAKVLSHPRVLTTSRELAKPLRGPSLPEAQQVEGAAALAFGLARNLGKARLHGELPSKPASGELAQTIPDCQGAELGKQLAADANVQLAGLAWSGSLGAVDVEMVNVFHAPLAEFDESMLMTGLKTMQQLYDTEAVTYFAAYLRNPDDAEAVARDVAAALRGQGLEVATHTFRDDALAPYYVGSVKFLASLVGFISLLVAAVVTLSVLNSMTLTILERARELGTLRALGFTRGEVAALLVRESVVLTVLAALVGIGVGLLAAYGINLGDIRFSPPGIPGTIQLIVTPTPLLCGVLAAIFLPLCAGATYLAVRKKSREEVVHLLTASAT